MFPSPPSTPAKPARLGSYLTQCSKPGLNLTTKPKSYKLALVGARRTFLFFTEVVMEIKSLSIENFKGIKKLEVELDGQNAVISAENGVGKTSVYDAFKWLLFDKDSTDRKQFELHPLDENNQPIKGLVSAVKAVINVDSVEIRLRKESHERVVKGQLRGYESVCFVDEVPKKVGEYQETISEFVDENIFKLLTDVYHFCSNLKWQDQRKALLDIAGELSSPTGFDELLEACGNRSLDDYKLVLAAQKKGYEKERSEINPRIDEISKSINSSAKDDLKTVTKQRDTVVKQIADIDKQRTAVFASEKKRQATIDKTNELKSDLANLERDILNSDSGCDLLREEKGRLNQSLSEASDLVFTAKQLVVDRNNHLESKQAELAKLRKRLDDLKAEREQIQNADGDENCPTCNQKWPDEKLAKIEQIKADSVKKIALQIAEIVKAGKQAKASVEAAVKYHDEAVEALNTANTDYDKLAAETSERIAEINKQMQEVRKPNPTNDPSWIKLNASIKKLADTIPASMAIELDRLETQKNEAIEQQATLNSTLANSDRIAADKKRITELEAREQEIAQELAEIDRLLTDIADYKQQESELLSQAVNDRFKHVTFKLFDILLNGSIEPCCEAMLSGVPYGDLSTGQKIIVGIDIINILAEHYGISVPLFIDNSESLTLPIERDGQVIELRAVKGQKKLKVEVVKTKKGMVA